jgi:ABC-2 type transport system permease protein
MLIVAHLFFGMQLPPSWGAAVAWLAATFSAVLLSAAFATLVTITALWTISSRGIVDVLVPCIWFFSGIVVPIPLFPDWAQGVLNFLPFRGIMDIPFRVYLGHIPLADVVPALAHQLGWTLFVILLGRWLLSLGTRRLVVQGG